MQIPAFHDQVGFNAHHSPMGAYFTFTCGHFGTRGGMGVQLGKPANQDLYIGVKDGDRYAPGPLRVLPFYEGAAAAPQANYTPEAAAAAEAPELRPYRENEITRYYAWATDTWKTADCEFVLYTPFDGIPDPATASNAAMRAALLPAVAAELVIDNRRGDRPKTGFFAINFNEGGARMIDTGLPPGRVGFALRSHLGVAGEVVEILPDGTRRGSPDSGIQPFPIMRWGVQEGLTERTAPVHLLGSTPGIGVEVPAGKLVVLRLALGCYLDGPVTTRLEGRYLYTRYFSGLTDALNEALTHLRFVKVECNTRNDKLQLSGLNPDQQFLIAHATRSYYGNTQLLDVAGQPYWIVNEGEYCMINTLDLAVDQVFWELHWNPWVVRNQLDGFVRHYSYFDEVKDPLTGDVYPGGIGFCHDQGAHNQFSPFGRSAYELPGLRGCFSHMTQEELCNWILMAACYVAKTGDVAWARAQEGVLEACLSSMRRRDHPAASKRAGVLRFDSTRCAGGQEITSYDSLDPSLAQARNNLYVAIKCWASYLGLALLGHAAFGAARGREFIAEATDAAHLDETSVLRQVGPGGVIPAIFEPGATDARILPAIEGLLYPLYWRTVMANAVGDHWAGGAFHRDAVGGLLNFTAGFYQLLEALADHTAALLADPAGRNKFPDGGVRLSSTSDNSWASKIAIVQHVARELFNLDEQGRQRKYRGDASGWEKADAAHTRWQVRGAGAYWAACDQVVNGVGRGSKYYPRLVTAALWLNNREL
jgi:hypothetical protein